MPKNKNIVYGRPSIKWISWKDNDIPANIRLDEDVFKTSFVFVFRRRLQDVFKMSWSRRIYSPYSYVFRRCFQDVLIKTNIFVLIIHLQKFFQTFSRGLQGAIKTSCKNVFKTSSRRLQDILKMLSRRLQDVFKASWPRRIYLPYSYVFRRRLQDVLIKTNIFVLIIYLQDIFEMFSRGLQDAFKISCKNVCRTSSRRL